MSARETVLEHAPGWTEEQAKRALRAAEGGRARQRGEKARRRREVRRQAAEFRAQQPEVSDVAALAREAREELEQRGS